MRGRIRLYYFERSRDWQGKIGGTPVVGSPRDGWQIVGQSYR